MSIKKMVHAKYTTFSPQKKNNCNITRRTVGPVVRYLSSKGLPSNRRWQTKSPT